MPADPVTALRCHLERDGEKREALPTLLSVCRVACAWWLSFRLRVT